MAPRSVHDFLLSFNLGYRNIYNSPFPLPSQLEILPPATQQHFILGSAVLLIFSLRFLLLYSLPAHIKGSNITLATFLNPTGLVLILIIITQ